jgi:uncharacterized membrane protein
MNKQNQTKYQPDLRNQGIYKDKNGRFIYFDEKKHVGYVIPEDELRRWGIVRMRFLVGILVGILVYTISKLNIYLSVLIGLGVYAGLESLYRTSMLPKYVKIENYQPDNKYDPKKDRFSGVSLQRNIFIIVVYCLFGVVALASTFIFDGKPTDNYLMYGVAIFSFIMAANTYYQYRK